MHVNETVLHCFTQHVAPALHSLKMKQNQGRGYLNESTELCKVISRSSHVDRLCRYCIGRHNG